MDVTSILQVTNSSIEWLKWLLCLELDKKPQT